MTVNFKNLKIQKGDILLIEIKNIRIPWNIDLIS